MVHSRERREFGRRKMKIKNKWEVVLVLVVVALGIVITTIAALKAKEKRQSMHAESKVSNNIYNINKSSVSPVREVATSRSVDRSNIITSSTNDHNKKTLFVSDNTSGRKTKFNHFTPDYDVEYDVVKSIGDEYAAMASETFDHLPKNAMRMPHDGLPGFPPPQGINNDFNSNAELTADGAGFVIESPSQSGPTNINVDKSGKNNGKISESIPKPSSNVEVKFNLKPSTNRVKSLIKISTNPVKNDPKRVAVFADPLLQADSNSKNIQRKLPESVKEEAKVAVPVKILSRIPVNNEKRPNNPVPDTSASMKVALPSIESAIQFLGLTDEFALQPLVQPSLAKIPIPVRRFVPHNNNNNHAKHEGLHLPVADRESKVRMKRQIENSPTFDGKSEPQSKSIKHILETLRTKSNNNSDDFPKQTKKYENEESELNTEESRYIPFDERSFITENREDNDGSDSEGDNNDNASPLFNYDDLENRFSSALSSDRHHKHNDHNYSPDESRKSHKYGILGSGNFEIIRGGVYSDEESASNNVPNYVHDNSQQDNRKSEPEMNDYTSNSEGNNEDDSEPNNQFGPFNVDFFSGSPVLGFQGYDNFGAASVDKYKAPSPVRSSIKLRGQRRHIYDEHSAASNLFTIAADKDLDSDS